MQEKQLTGMQETYLDVFRIMAAVFVIFGHSFIFYQVTPFKDQSCFPFLQNIGVVMLFLLSGFLTEHSIVRKNKLHDYTFPEFFRHKTIRIMKEYIPALCAIVLIDYIAIKLNADGYGYYDCYNPLQFIGNVFMLQGTFVNTIPGILILPFGSDRPLWTLSLEWWYYLVFGSFYLLIANKRTLDIKKVLLLAVFIVLPIRTYTGLAVCFIMGIAGYWWYDRFSIKTARLLFVLSVAGFIVYGIFHREAYSIYSYLILSCIFCFGVRSFASNKEGQNTGKGHRIGWIKFLSGSTFFLYLIHYSIISLLHSNMIAGSLKLTFAAGIILPWIFAMGLYYVFGQRNALVKLLRIDRIDKR